jgi:tyrosine-protein phosphatase YwqE
MLSFLSKKHSIQDSNLLKNFTDIHTHILPGVDDGVREKNEAIDTLNKLEELGVKGLYLTPHIMKDYKNNNSTYLKNRFHDLLKEYNGNLRLKLAAEYMLDSDFNDHISNNKEMLTISDNHILVETSYLNPPLNFDKTLEDIKAKGYVIILAHPERYLYMDWTKYIELYKTDFLFFQLNILSLVGYYGKRVQDNANRILNKGFYKYIGSDIHNYEKQIKGYRIKMFSRKQIAMLEELKNNNDSL